MQLADLLRSSVPNKFLQNLTLQHPVCPSNQNVRLSLVNVKYFPSCLVERVACVPLGDYAHCLWEGQTVGTPRLIYRHSFPIGMM